VLGITNLSQVRAGNLSELVYKQGQAGVNKASVTIVFNNEDPSTSPVGYEQCTEVTVTRQVLIGGRSKYLINGRNAPAGQVQNLFHSVQLNVNNPHFLIMQGMLRYVTLRPFLIIFTRHTPHAYTLQDRHNHSPNPWIISCSSFTGRITKVLNMKPDEILGMVEEAAGTRMYETKRIAAIKTIDKKQMKVDELNSVLAEEITPTLERLRGEKQHYLKWSKNNADIERIERFVVASEFMNAQETLMTNNQGVAAMEEEIAEKETTVEQCSEQIAEKEQEISALSSKLNGEFEEHHAEVKRMEEARSKELVKATSVWQNGKNTVSRAGEDLAAAKELVVETQDSVKAKNDEVAQDSAHIERAQAEASAASDTLSKLSAEYKNMCAGISSEESDEGMTLPDQISKAHSDANNAEPRLNKLQ
jgi:structural maintenance of chromosome 2